MDLDIYNEIWKHSEICIFVLLSKFSSKREDLFIVFSLSFNDLLKLFLRDNVIPPNRIVE